MKIDFFDSYAKDIWNKTIAKDSHHRQRNNSSEADTIVTETQCILRERVPPGRREYWRTKTIGKVV